MTNQEEPYCGFIISWPEPPVTGAKWTANVAPHSLQYRHLFSSGSHVIDGGTREEMLAAARRHIDQLIDSTKATVRDLFLEALAKKNGGHSPRQIHRYLIDRGHQTGHSLIDDVGSGDAYEITFQTGVKINFDGTTFHHVRI